MKGIVYQIICNITDEVYIGSTYDLKKRGYLHKKLNCSSKNIIERGNYTTKILEEFEDITTIELRKKEQEYILKINCINVNNAYTDQKEYDKKYNYDYYHKYKDEKRESKKITDKEYYNKNKDKLLANIVCECGSNYGYVGKSRHLKTQKHIKYLNDLHPECA